ncbi:MAG TPA: hypothetical protein VK553_01695 [Candidatus Nitrosopolaris rasttigaisensis]|nr:hypothetical protein [Candidatus Nitrosopolaris rasttigaisensis]
MIYAGIGGRKTPSHICDLMEKIAHKLASSGLWILRSGHAKGADKAFEQGCVSANGPMEIYTGKSDILDKAFNIAEQFHPKWDACNPEVKRLHARNSMIILGADLVIPCDVVICYAPGGNKWGGTSQGIRIAEAYHIPVVNMFNENVYQILKDTYDV